MEGTTIGLALLTIVIAFLIKILIPSKRPKNFPPGPPRIPLFGNALTLGEEGYKVAMELGKKYGDILGVQMGSYWSVILNNPEDSREAFNKLEFSGRYGYNSLLDENNDGQSNYGVILSSGKRWMDLRRFSLKTLRDHGFGKRSMESIIQEEAHELIAEFKAHDVGKPISTRNRFNGAVLNVVWSIISGSRYSHSDPKLNELNLLLTETITSAFKGIRQLNFMFPAFVEFRKKFPFLFSQNDEFQDKTFTLLRKTIKEHRDTIELGNPRDFIDTYLEEAIRTKDDANTSFETVDDDLPLVVLLMDFFAAGSETTSTTMTWALFLLALYPTVQEKLVQEIETVVGNRIVRLDDRAQMPYTEATMTEIHRVGSLVGMNVPHATTQDVIFKGYNIPKNTLVFGNIYGAHFRDSWGDPFNFRPERFLSNDLKTFNRHSDIIAFSVGKRQCLGETLARDEFFVFLTNIVQQLQITFPHDEPKHSIAPQPGLVLTPEPHRILLLNRNA